MRHDKRISLQQRNDRTMWTFLVVATTVVALLSLLALPTQSLAVASKWTQHGDLRQAVNHGSFEYPHDGMEGRQWFCAIQNDSFSPITQPAANQDYQIQDITKDSASIRNIIVKVGGVNIPASATPEIVHGISYALWQARDAYRDNAALNRAVPGVFYRFLHITNSDFESQMRADEKAYATRLFNEATHNKGPYSITMSSSLSDDKATMELTNIGVKSAEGTYFDGGSHNASRGIELTIDGPAVFADTGKKTLVLPLSSKAHHATVRAYGNGTVHVDAKARNLPSVNLNVWKPHGKGRNGEIFQDLMSYGSPTQAHHGLSAPMQSMFTPRIATAVNDNVINDKQKVVDNLEVSSADNLWSQVDGKYVPLVAIARLYGPYDTPQAAREQRADDAEKVIETRQVLLSKGPGKYSVEFASDISTQPGFYTITTDVDKHLQRHNAMYLKDSFASRMWEESESVVVPWTPDITSKATTTRDADTTYISDTVVVTGLPTSHTSFTGVAHWQADTQTIDQYLYCLPPEFDSHHDSTRNLTPLSHVHLPARNGTYTIDKDSDGKPLAIGGRECIGRYVFVTDYSGDSRSHALRTKDDDVDESYIPPEPTVTTLAQSFDAHKGKVTLGDRINVVTTETLPTRYSVTSTLYSWPTHDQPVCDDAHAIFTSEPITVTKPGVYETNKTTVIKPEGATFGWVETLTDTVSGRVVHHGVCGAEKETYELPPVDITTVAHNNNGRDGQAITGESIYDTINVDGYVATGHAIVVNLFRNEPNSPLTCDQPIWTSTPIPVDGSTTYRSETYQTHQAGIYHFQEELRDAEGKTVMKGQCGARTETVEVRNPVVSTRASLFSLQSVDSNIVDNTITVNDRIFDTVVAHDPLPKDAHVVVELYKNNHGQKITCHKPVWTSEPIALSNNSTGTLRTQPISARQEGVYHFRQKVVYQGHIISQDECGAPTETLRVIKDVAPRPPLAKTGNDSHNLGLYAALSVVIGGLVIARRRIID